MFDYSIKNKDDLKTRINEFCEGKWDLSDLPIGQYVINNYGNSYFQLGIGQIIICKNAELPILRGHLPTISRIILEDLNNGKYKLHIRDMSQDIEDPIPRFEITAEDFQVYRWDYEKYGIKNERGWYENIPTLKEFIKWYEENCEADQKG